MEVIVMNKAEIYTWTFCPYCIDAKKLLESKNIPYTEYKIDRDNEKKKELYNKTGQDTVPYIFINDTFIGGYDELKDLNI